MIYHSFKLDLKLIDVPDFFAVLWKGSQKFDDIDQGGCHGRKKLYSKNRMKLSSSSKGAKCRNQTYSGIRQEFYS